MLEATISSGISRGQTYPDSGPGPKTLKNGSAELGYFGEVSASELFNLSDLRRQLNFWAGTDNNTNPVWVKMFLSGKVIYFPFSPLASGMSWNILYAAGLVYGTDNNGTVPGTPAVNQLAYATKGTDNFKVRCFKSQESDPASQGGIETIGTSALLKAAEWGRVISAIVSPRQTGYTGDNWALYPYNTFMLPGTSMAISQNTRQADQTSCLGINNTQVGLLPKAVAGYLWFPVLELIPSVDPVYFPIKDQTGVTQGKFVPVVVNDPSYEDSLIAYRSFGGFVQMGRMVSPGEVEYLDSYYRIDVSKTKVTTNPGLPLIAGPATYE